MASCNHQRAIPPLVAVKELLTLEITYTLTSNVDLNIGEMETSTNFLETTTTVSCFLCMCFLEMHTSPFRVFICR